MLAADFVALFFFVACWVIFAWVTGGARVVPRTSLTQLMSERRRQWMLNSLQRDLKMIDTQILAGLQNGTAFFASTSIFAIGGCFALLGATDQADAVFRDLPFVSHSGRSAFELKVCGLTAIFGYSFFKFGWSYRLFNYCTILFGGLPMLEEARHYPLAAREAAERVARMNMIAAKHFNAGLRAIFLSIGYLGWFAGPYVFMITTSFVFLVLTRRQFFSEAREAVLDEMRHEKAGFRD
jgi:Predicted membrane protein